MNLAKLFETQKELRNRIAYNESDRFNKLVLALLVELGECANEWRGFKFWSKNQSPRTKATRNVAMMEEDKIYYNPLLEEYVDGLHFLLELGIELGEEEITVDSDYTEGTPNETFVKLYKQIADLLFCDFPEGEYEEVFNLYVGLGELQLGFTWEEVEAAYFEKNAVNHRRQDDGY